MDSSLIRPKPFKGVLPPIGVSLPWPTSNARRFASTLASTWLNRRGEEVNSGDGEWGKLI